MDQFLKMAKKYSPILNAFGYIIALVTLIITAHSAISSKQSLNLAILQYQESLLPTWSWIINDSANILTIQATDTQVEVEEVRAFFPTQIVGEDREWNIYPPDHSLHIVMLKGNVERYFEGMYKYVEVKDDEIICSTIVIPTFMQIVYIHKGQRKMVNEIFSLRCESVYDIERPIQIMFSKMYLEGYLQNEEQGQKSIDKLFDDSIKEFKVKLENKYKCNFRDYESCSRRSKE